MLMLTRMAGGFLFLIGIAAMAQSPEPSPDPSPAPSHIATTSQNASVPTTVTATPSEVTSAQPAPEDIVVSSATETKTIDAAPGSQLGWQPVAVSYITGLQVILVPMIVAMLRSKLDRLPRISIPIVAVIVGITSDLVATQIAGGGFDMFRGACVGFGGQILRELVNTWAHHRMRA